MAAVVGFVWWRYDVTDLERVLEWNRAPCDEIVRVLRVSEGVRSVECADGHAYAVVAQISCTETMACNWVKAACFDVNALTHRAMAAR